ncbi:hypothetical protein CKM354_000607200 [Cercospora kikuchii]|uniref:Uncharacterized protein n=1 Tax=Cercospora kikuchii TaxID=84275 RepID=A0A9P3CHF6_9PEZI|nr:uncharacterized protein CKM354_000607200 [Cercospora kikuchii]GIZ42818.1 hypothetical protein CKM354_000607200 [Cercospora kikuchii]
MGIIIKVAVPITTALIRGKTIRLQFAKETQDWRRPGLPKAGRDGFLKAMQRPNIHVPEGATTATMTHVEHSSPGDKIPHWTVVWEDAQGNHLETAHIYDTPEEESKTPEGQSGPEGEETASASRA